MPPFARMWFRSKARNDSWKINIDLLGGEALLWVWPQPVLIWSIAWHDHIPYELTSILNVGGFW